MEEKKIKIVKYTLKVNCITYLLYYYKISEEEHIFIYVLVSF